MSLFQGSTVLRERVVQNWKSGLTVALISVPLSIALSIASGVGPLPGLIAGIWGTLIGSLFIGSEFNIIGAAGALTTVLFAATLAAPLGLGAALLPLLAILSGILIFIIWFLKLERYLYYIPSSVMYGFATGVAFLIAIAQLFDATGLSQVSRTGHFWGDIEKFVAYSSSVHIPSIVVFALFLGGILIWKRFVPRVPAVIAAAVLGIVFGYIETKYFSLDLYSLQDKFGSFSATLFLPVDWAGFITIVATPSVWKAVMGTAGLIALISVLETLITAKLGDKLTKTESSSSRELLGLALANLGSGVMGGLPTTGVFIRTGANIKAGATHRTSGVIAALSTGVIALVILPLFSYIPMVVIAAILVNTAIGLLETDKFVEYWKFERESFVVALLVTLVTVFHDAGLAVGVGALVALLVFAQRVSHGRCDIIWNYTDDTIAEERSKRSLTLPEATKTIRVVTYSIAGNLGYIDAGRHFTNLKLLAKSGRVPAVIIRLRDLFSLDIEGGEALADAVQELIQHQVRVFVSSTSPHVRQELLEYPVFQAIEADGRFTRKTREALELV